MKKAWLTFIQWLPIIFGQLRWTPPVWISRVWNRFWQSRAGTKIKNSFASAKKNPRQAAKWAGSGLAAVLVLSVTGYYIYDYYDNLPKPNYASVTLEPPSISSMSDKKVYGLSLHFSKSVAPLDMVGKEIVDGIFLSPKLKGKWTWSTDKSIVFLPEAAEAFKTDWMTGTEYEIEFRKKIFAPQIELKEYEIKFTTAALSFYNTPGEFYIDPRNEKIKKVMFTLTASVPLDTEDFKKRLSLSMQPEEDSLLGKSATSLKYKVTFNEYQNEAYIESENIDLPRKNHVAKIKIAQGAQSRRGGEGLAADVESTVAVPGLFEALQISEPKIIFARNEKYEPEQVLVFGTGVDVKPDALEKHISIQLLPKDRVNPITKKVDENYRWTSASEVTPDVSKKLSAARWTLLPGLHPQNSQHSLRIEAPVHRYLLFTVSTGVRGVGGFELRDSFEEVLRVPDYTPELLFMSEGSILTLSGDRKLPVLSRNVKKIKYEIGRVLPSHSNILIARLAESSTFSKPSLYGGIEDSIMERFEEKSDVEITSSASTNYSSLDLNNYIRGVRGFYYIKAYRWKSHNSGDDEEEQYAQSSCEDDESGECDVQPEMAEESVASEKDGSYYLGDSRLVMITDLGIIAKTTNTKKMIIFVQNLATGLPVSDASIAVLGVNGISILETRTDSVGRAEIADLSSYSREKRPIAIMARKNDDFAYLPYNMSERELSYSRFDVSGVYEDTSVDAINAMLFSDRELYRPGETANIGILLRSQASGKQQTLPFKITITDPRGQAVKSESISASLFGIKDYQFKTSETSPTGTYSIALTTAPKSGSNKYPTVIGTVEIRVEEFVPDKLRITAQMDPPKAVGWIPLEKATFNVSLNNLFGSPAENRVVKPDLVLVPTAPSVPKFKSYTFMNPNSNDAQTANGFLSEKKTDAKGNAAFEVDLTKYKGFYALRFSAEGFEAEGGRSVSARAGGYASQLHHLVGYKADGSLQYIKKDDVRKVNLIAIDNQFAASGVEVSGQLVFNEFVSSLVKQDDGTYKYKSVKKEKPEKTEKWKIGAKGLDVALPTDKAGLFTYIISDTDGNELNRFDFNVVGETNLTRSLDRNAELQLTLSKEDFSAGEEIEINIIAPYAGAGLITIERDTVYAQKWFQASTNSTTQKIKLPEGFTGNGYINITLLRAKDSKEIYMSPLSYGVIPFTVNADRVKTTITLTSPDKVKPGETLDITYSANQPTSMVLYGVDEGIISAARYQFPDPIKHYFKKRALQVSTYQLLDLVLPEYSLLKQSYAPGGDGMGKDLLGANLNPFKRKGLAPVVFWSGVIKADSTKKTFQYKVPDYFNGNIKIYAIANSEKGIGSSTHQALARADFVISPTPPLFVSPSDEFEVGVLVSNQSEGKGQKEDLDISVKPTKHVQVSSPPKVTVNIPQGREVGTSFRFKATNQLGSADIVFSATNGTLSSSIEQSLSVRPAMPYITTTQFDMTSKTSVELPLGRTMFPEFAKANLTVSASPVALALGLFNYLDNYQYLCTEQLISMTIPYVFLPEVRKGKKDVKDSMSAADRHAATISMLRTRQASDGGFALYGGGESNVAATLYAALYLVEARDHGMSVPTDLLERSKQFLTSISIQETEHLSQTRIFAQALYLQARLGVVPGTKLNFLREKLEKDFKDKWENDITAIWLAGAYSLVQKQDAGWAILKNVDLKANATSDYEHFYDNNVRVASLVHVAAAQFPDKMSTFLNSDTLEILSKDLIAGKYNTHSAARMIMAFMPYQKYAASKGFPGALKILEKFGKQETALKWDAKAEILDLPITPTSTAVAIQDSPVTPYFYAMSVSGFDKELPKTEIKSGIEVNRTLAETKAKLGSEIQVSTKIRGIKEKYIPHVVVMDLFPAGFELILDSVETVSVEYVDKREDRVVVYLNASQDMAEVKYRLKAVNKGKYVLPPVYAESMYDKGIQYRGVSQTVEIL